MGQFVHSAAVLAPRTVPNVPMGQGCGVTDWLLQK